MRERDPADQKTFTVGICQLVQHEALDAAMLRYLCGTVEHVQAIGGELDPMTVAARDDFLKKSENAVY